MITTNIWKGMAKVCSACLVFLCLWVMVPGAWAAHEVSQSDIKANVTTNTITKWSDDLTVEWKLPSMGSDILNGYLYKWNDSASSLNAADTPYTSFSAAVDGTVDANLDPPNVVKPKEDLVNLDSGNVLYLHIMTFYLASGVPTVSSDVVYGPFLIDNVAPVGTVRIVDATGTNDITSTSDTRVYLKLSAAKDPIKMYLSETSNRPASGQSYAADVVYDLGDKTPGSKTIYAWFEDSVLNISKAPATDSFTLLSAANISPNAVTLDLATSATQVFRVEGTDATYNWSIINEVPETSGTVAQFTGTSSATNSVTVQGLAKGTFKLQAVPTSGVGTLTSGTISVVQTATSKTYNLITTSTTSVNAIVLSRSGTGYTKASQLFAAVPNCDGLSRWSATFQAYDGYDNIFGTNDFDLVVGEPYFVSVSGVGAFTVRGSSPAVSYNLKTTSTTNVNAISLPQSKSGLTKASLLFADIPSIDGLSRWSAAFQAYDGYDNIFGTNDFALSVDEAYFVSVSSPVTTWP